MSAGTSLLVFPDTGCLVGVWPRANWRPTRPPALVPARFTCDDVDFNLRVHSAGLLLCRFNRFSVMKKQIAVGGHRSFHITSKVGAAVCPERAAAHGGKAGGEATGHLRVSGVGLTAGKC